MRVLVTGGTGYLGAAIVRDLASRGHQPVVFARRASSANLPGVPIDGDVRDRGALAHAAQAVDAIIHTAALVSIWREDAREFDDVNVGGLRNVLAVAQAAGVARVVYTSTFLALPPNGSTEPIKGNDYQRTKRRAREEAVLALEAGSPLVILYPGVVYGPGAATEGNLVARLLRDHRAGRLPGIIGASRLWSFAYVDDVAAAHVEAIERPQAHGEYLLGGVNVPQMRLFEVARASTGTSLPRRIPLAAARAAGALDDMRARMFGRTPLITRATVEIFSHDWSMDSSRAMRELGYQTTSLEAGVASTLASLSGHGRQ